MLKILKIVVNNFYTFVSKWFYLANHKDIGILYLMLIHVLLLSGFMLAFICVINIIISYQIFNMDYFFSFCEESKEVVNNKNNVVIGITLFISCWIIVVAFQHGYLTPITGGLPLVIPSLEVIDTTWLAERINMQELVMHIIKYHQTNFPGENLTPLLFNWALNDYILSNIVPGSWISNFLSYYGPFYAQNYLIVYLHELIHDYFFNVYWEKNLLTIYSLLKATVNVGS